METLQVLEELRVIDPVCEQIAIDILDINHAFERGEISAEERNHLLAEIRDIRVANDLAGNEIAVRYACQAIELILGVV